MTPKAARGGARGTLLALLVAASVGLAGCAQLTDIHDRSLIFGLGIDEGAHSGLIALSAQALHPPEAGSEGAGGAGGGAGGGKGGQWRTLVASGPTLAGALGQLQAETDRRVFLGQLGVVFIGTSLARRGIVHDLGALVRSTQVPETLAVAVTEGRAAPFLRQGTSQQVAWMARKFLTTPRAGAAVLPNPLWHFMAQSLGMARATYAPLFAAAPEGLGLRFVGTAVFLDGRMVDALSPEQSTALAWLTKREGFGGVTVGTPPDEFHVAIHRVRARWDLSTPASPRLHVAATGEVTAAPRRSPTGGQAAMQRAAGGEMAAQLRTVLSRLQVDGADLVGIGERLRERGALPTGAWPGNFAKLRFTVSVQVHLVALKVR